MFSACIATKITRSVHEFTPMIPDAVIMETGRSKDVCELYFAGAVFAVVIKREGQV